MKQPIISITFDDVPRTAFINAVPILDNNNIKATFYVAMGLTNEKSNTDSVTYLKPKDIVDLNNQGHDIACHTYSHYMLTSGTAENLLEDANKNVTTLCQLLNTQSIDHFSYPYGQVNFREKKLLTKKYKTMRSSRPGINLKRDDFNLLRATSIYSPSFDKDAIAKIINKTVKNNGWLIFYTHGVEDNPDSYSCTPEQFAWVLQQCINSKAKILPVSEAYQLIKARQ